MAANEISMQMRFDNVFDLEILSFGFGDVLIDVALRIDYGRFTVCTDQVGSVGQATEIELFEVHWVIVNLSPWREVPNSCRGVPPWAPFWFRGRPRGARPT